MVRNDLGRAIWTESVSVASVDGGDPAQKWEVSPWFWALDCVRAEALPESPVCTSECAHFRLLLTGCKVFQLPPACGFPQVRH